MLGAGDSVTDRYAAGQDALCLGPEYDPSVEDWPLELDARGRSLALVGCGPGVTRLPGGVEIVGGGTDCYHGAPTVAGLAIDGGDPGLELRAAPYATVRSVSVGADGDGFAVREDPDGAGSYGVTFTTCQAWNCGGDGFALDRDAHPHATQFTDCHAVANAGHGYRLRGANVTLRGGSVQLNHGYGVEVRGTTQTRLADAYVEGNGRSREYPVDVYARGVRGLTVEGCYNHAINPRDTPGHDCEFVQRALTVHDSEAVRFRDCTSRRYGDCAAAFFDCERVTSAPETHVLDGCTLTSGGED